MTRSAGDAKEIQKQYFFFFQQSVHFIDLLRGLDTLGRSSIFYKGDNFCDSCLPFYILSLLWGSVLKKRTCFLGLHVKNLFSKRGLL